MTETTVLMLNAGSSSIKAALFAPGAVLRAIVEGLPDSPNFTAHDAAGAVLADEAWPDAPLARLLDFIDQHLGRVDLGAIGHRVVHGGSRPGPCHRRAGRGAGPSDAVRPTAPAALPGGDPGDRAPPARTPASRLLRHGLPPHT